MFAVAAKSVLLKKRDVESSDGPANIGIRTRTRRCAGRQRVNAGDVSIDVEIGIIRRGNRQGRLSEVDFSFLPIDGLTKVFVGIVSQCLPVNQRGSAITS